MSIAMTAGDPTTLRFLFTAADVAALPSSLPSGDVKYELNNGNLIVMPPPGNLHGSYQLRLGSELLTQGENRGFGKSRVESGVLLWQDPDRLTGPDAMFFTNARLPLRESSEGYFLTIPDFVAEVRSKNDGASYIAEKVRDYLKAGVLVVWVVDPAKRIVTEHRPDQPPRVFGDTDTLTLEDLIPGFSLAVEAIFKD